MSTRTRFGAILVALVVLVGLAIPASAYTTTRQVNRTNITYSIYFNKFETQQVAWGATACTGTIGRIPLIGAYATTVCGLAGAWAVSALSGRGCIGVNRITYYSRPGSVFWQPFYHNKTRCR